MDEPTAFLDIGHQLAVMDTARALAGEDAPLASSCDLCLALKRRTGSPSGGRGSRRPGRARGHLRLRRCAGGCSKWSCCALGKLRRLAILLHGRSGLALFPLFVELDGLDILIVGGGQVAKAQGAEPCRNMGRWSGWVAPKFCRELEEDGAFPATQRGLSRS